MIGLEVGQIPSPFPLPLGLKWFLEAHSPGFDIREDIFVAFDDSVELELRTRFRKLNRVTDGITHD
jgi:hypothetical protein